MPRREDIDEPDAPSTDGGGALRRRTISTAVLFVVLCLVALVGARTLRADRGSSSPRAVAATTVAETTVATTIAPTTTVPGPLPCPPEAGAAERVTSFAFAPPTCLVPGATYRAIVASSEGSFTITLDPASAPNNVNSFVYLARYRFYDGLTFNRVIPGFIVQGGDPSGDGSGGPGYTIADELPSGFVYSVGTVAMANSGPDTNGSQFFVVSGSLGKQLPASYPVLGTITSGLDVVRRIDSLGVAPAADGSEAPPVRRITIEKVVIVQEGGTATSTTAAGATTVASTTA